MPLPYPHTITVTRTSGATASSTGGWNDDGTSATVYSGRADVQDSEGPGTFEEGQWRRRGDAVALLPDAVDIGDFARDDLVSIAWGDSTTTSARVTDVLRLDDALLISYLEG